MSDDHSQSEFEKLVRSREELQYIAGVLDSEGSIMLLRYMADIPWRIRPRITITNIDRHLLERCRRILGAGRIEWVYKRKSKVLRLAIERRSDIARTLQALLPFIKLKKSQALLMLTFLRSDREAGHEFILACRMRQLNGSE